MDTPTGLLSLLRSSVCRNVLLCLSLGTLLTDSFFIARLGQLAAAGFALVKQLRKEVLVSILVEDQFTLAWGRVGLCFLYLKQGGSRSVHAADFHEGQVGIFQHADGVLTRRKFGVAHMELKWDVGLKVAGDLRMRLARIKRESKTQCEQR